MSKSYALSAKFCNKKINAFISDIYMPIFIASNNKKPPDDRTANGIFLGGWRLDRTEFVLVDTEDDQPYDLRRRGQ